MKKMAVYCKCVGLIVVAFSIFGRVESTNADRQPTGYGFTVAGGGVCRQGELLVRFAPRPDGKQRSTSEKNQILTSLGGAALKHSFKIVPGLSLVKLPAEQKVEDALKTFNNMDGILYAGPNYKLELMSTFPNDPCFSEQWGLHNTGQTGGTEDADIDAPEAWDIATDANDIIVAVIDTGIDRNHPDLAANMWVNEDELNGDPNVDDDGNGYVDDIYGWNFYDDNNDTTDGHAERSDGHGTLVAGTIGAVGDNNEGVVGVCWNVKIMNLRIFPEQPAYPAPPIIPDPNTVISSAMKAVEYAVDKGTKVLSNAYGYYIDPPIGIGWSPFPDPNKYFDAFKDVIEAAGEAGVLFVVAAGNEDVSNDEHPIYPQNYDCNNIIVVMATDADDNKAGFSNYDANKVDLAAPGTDILSCRPVEPCPPSCDNEPKYRSGNGTSFAQPHVAGACAQIWAANPYLGHLQVKKVVLDTVDVIDALENDPDYGRLCVTGGRLNVYKAMDSLYNFIVKNSVDEIVAWFDSFGNLFLADELYPSSSHPATGHDEFRVQDSNGVDVAIIDTTNGKMYIKGTLKLDSEGNWVAPTDGDDNFRIKDRSGNDVAYISKAGDLYLKGKLYEDANP